MTDTPVAPAVERLERDADAVLVVAGAKEEQEA
jgi:hypothetical protein